MDTSRTEATIQRYLELKGFSGTILIAEKGKPVFLKNYSLPKTNPPDRPYHFAIASITKLFTSIRIFQLVENHEIYLDQPVAEILPDFSNYLSDQITVSHLLLHISGLPKEPDSLYSIPLPPEEMMEQVFSTGEQGEIGVFRYNNMDYVLLGRIIQKLSGKSWEENLQENILYPLGMKETGFLKRHNLPQPFANTYHWVGNTIEKDPDIHIQNYYAAGAMYSTAEDLLKLDQGLYKDILLKSYGRELLQKSFPEYNYSGYGVWNYQYPFVNAKPTIMERRGGIGGANAVLMRLTESQTTLIILSNDNRFNPDSFGDPENLRESLLRSLFEK
jgi:CubicO group peptidase (beta-lactamase class C family)